MVSGNHYPCLTPEMNARLCDTDNVPTEVSPLPGWTIDPEELEYEGEWAAVNSWGYHLATAYELGTCIPIMCNPQGGEILFEVSGNSIWSTRCLMK